MMGSKFKSGHNPFRINLDFMHARRTEVSWRMKASETKKRKSGITLQLIRLHVTAFSDYSAFYMRR